MTINRPGRGEVPVSRIAATSGSDFVAYPFNPGIVTLCDGKLSSAW
jgi:hypothetical protein